MKRDTWVTILVLTMSGCSEPRAVHPDASSLFHCGSNADCDDHITCTVDNCDVSGTCQHTGIDSMCSGAGEHCVVGVGCSAMMSCSDSTMCDDGVACTLDRRSHRERLALRPPASW